MKKILVTVLAAVTAMGLLAGCGGSDESGDGFSYGEEITVISREDGSGTRGAFVELTGVEEDDTDNTTVDAIIANKTGVVMQNVASDPYAIGYISLGSLDDTIKALSIGGVEATAENVVNGSYELARPFNIAYKGELNEIAADFVAYIMSAEGQTIVEDEGYVKVSEDGENYTAAGLSGKVVISGSSSVGPVMEVLAEEYMALNPDVTIEVQISDSSTGMQNAIDGTCDIGMASRDLKEAELAELTNMEIAIDGIAVVVK
jgi:phosphate transport system substrate-binding protein